MDKFDEMMKQAKTTYEPSSNFVEETMQQLPTKQQPIKHRLRLWLVAGGATLALMALLFVVLPTMIHPTTQRASQASSVASTGQSTGTTATLPAGTNNTNLASDLSSITASESQENTDQSSATTALNDSSQQIAVPTN